MINNDSNKPKLTFATIAAQISAMGFEQIHHMLAGRLPGGAIEAQSLAEAMDTILVEEKLHDRSQFVSRLERHIIEYPEIRETAPHFVNFFEEYKEQLQAT